MLLSTLLLPASPLARPWPGVSNLPLWFAGPGQPPASPSPFSLTKQGFTRQHQFGQLGCVCAGRGSAVLPADPGHKESLLSTAALHMRHDRQDPRGCWGCSPRCWGTPPEKSEAHLQPSLLSAGQSGQWELGRHTHTNHSLGSCWFSAHCSFLLHTEMSSLAGSAGRIRQFPGPFQQEQDSGTCWSSQACQNAPPAPWLLTPCSAQG